DGQIEQVGTPASLYERPRTSFVAGFIGDTNLFPGRVDGAGCFQTDGIAFRVAGSGMAASIRPEKVRVGSRLAEAPSSNVFDGSLEEIVFLGSIVRYRVRLPSGPSVTAQTQNDARRPPGQIGDSVQVGWDVESAVMLER
ncbi:MAG: TOBE domain-containing protein, partial [Chloroflexota bacterium]